jgi:hypothetical protein
MHIVWLNCVFPQPTLINHYPNPYRENSRYSPYTQLMDPLWNPLHK